jgi:hypothetical protein
MSMLLRPSTTGAVIESGVGRNDDSIQPADYRVSLPQMYGVADQLRFTDILWRRSQRLGTGGQDGGTQGLGGGILDAAGQYWEWNFPPTGMRRRKFITGFVYDVTGSPVSGAIVQLYDTATGLLVDQTTSAGDGSYTVGDPNAVNCFLVGYLFGSPDTAGTTVDTVAGS